ncbi:MAG: helix-turn-helix domain-containing protein [Novosphingobium sp.]
MSRHSRPGIDPALAPRLGVSRDGQPLSYNRLPAPDLAPWIGWLYVASVEMPDDYQLQCSLLNDTAMIRIQLSGDWTAETRDGTLNYSRSAMYCGPQSKAMPIRVRGSFKSVGFALNPGAGVTVTGLPASDYLDRMVPLDEINLPGNGALEMLQPGASPEEWLQVLEGMARGVLALRRAQEPDPVSARFERLALTDPSASVADFAKECGISLRQLERICQRDFGLPPKQVLRRARAIDMASHLRGVADRAEAAELELRYYDQSHMIREFTKLFGMAPRQFVETPQPLMTLALESRQSRRLAVLDRLAPGADKPWSAGS